MVNNLSVIVINFDFNVFVYMFVVHDFGLFQSYAEADFEAASFISLSICCSCFGELAKMTISSANVVAG